MPAADERIIEFSRTQILLILFGLCALEAVALWMYSLDAATIESLSRRINDPALLHASAILKNTSSSEAH